MDREHSVGDAAQLRLIAEQLVDAAIIKVQTNAPPPPPPTMPIPAPLKWAAGIVSAVLAALCTSACIWIAVTLSDMKVAVNGIELQLGENGAIAARFNDIDRRLSNLEKQMTGDKR